MTTHTPGQWKANAVLKNRIVGDETAVEFDKIQICGANCAVATVYRRSDARLITAAPDLLAALEVAQEELRLIRMKDVATTYHPGLDVQIELAIAKARS